MITIEKIKSFIIDICDTIYSEGLVKNGEGNVSIRVPNKEEYIITPTGNNYRNLEKSNLVHMNFSDDIYGKNRPSSEFRMHRTIYTARPNAQCIVHTHSPYASSLSILRKSIPVIIEEMAIFLGGNVPCTEYTPAGTDTLAKKILSVTKDKNVAIIANHGVVIVGKNPDYCIKAAIIVEKMAKIYLNALRIDDVQIIPSESQTPLIKIFQEKYSTS